MKLSAVLNTYNHVKSASEAIESILMQQTSFDFEIVVVDDCSTDGTQEILRSYARRHPGRFKLVLHEKNLGDALDPIEMVRHASGDYIALLEGDDYWTDPDKLQAQVSFLEANQDYVLCGHNCIVRNEWANASELKEQIFADIDLTTRQIISFDLPTGSVVYRHRLLSEWPECFRKLGFTDRPFQVLMSKQGRVRFLAKPMSVYRVHSGGTWSGRYCIQSDKVTSDTTAEGWRKMIEFWEVLGEYLRHEYDDEISRLIAVAHTAVQPRSSRELQIVEVRRIERQDVIFNFSLDRPQAGDRQIGSYEIAGWMLGRQPNRVQLAKLYCNDKLIGSAPLSVDRPDVAKVFPDYAVAARCGFGFTGPASLIPDEFVLRLAALVVDPDGAVVEQPVAEIRGSGSGASVTH